MPTISVIMSNYNHAAYLSAALASLRAQTFSDFEVIIIDDGSTDDSVQILQAMADADGRFTIHVRPTNRGLMANVPDLMAMATAPIFTGSPPTICWSLLSLPAQSMR
jgi:GT2 family glycosyltransferase